MNKESHQSPSIHQDTMITNHNEFKELETIYKKEAHHLVEQYLSTLRSNFFKASPKKKELVGLLTFPNSGTSWFLRFSQVATGIYSHTVYEQEYKALGGWKNRKVYMVQTNSNNQRPPYPLEPALVKSHVSHYGAYPEDFVDLDNFDKTAQKWIKHLPPNSCRHIRLARNPFDNLRARYHLELKAGRDKLSFREFFRQDLRRYFVWHECCNELTEKAPVLTVLYSSLLANTQFEFHRALEFAGYKLNASHIKTAYNLCPPSYSEKESIPIHLKYFSEEDVLWVANEIKLWLAKFN